MSPRPPCSAIALDVGRKRVGLAGCDPLGLTVTPLPALQRRGVDEDAQTLATLASRRQATVMVVGLPLDDNQRLTLQARHCLRYGRQLAEALAARGRPLSLVWVNEHGSTWEAADRFGLRGDRSGKLDSAAAALLLEQWLREGTALAPDPASSITPPPSTP
ncbi:MAG: Holliday junction resolvase RuvX [Cyanobacteria bacterium K_Offshore_surface_m2_239]|nr:Holliday junction resolvase RuvX [Cyanobacteria bacterium K_Offshore_surface_m2_239]